MCPGIGRGRVRGRGRGRVRCRGRGRGRGRVRGLGRGHGHGRSQGLVRGHGRGRCKSYKEYAPSDYNDNQATNNRRKARQKMKSIIAIALIIICMVGCAETPLLSNQQIIEQAQTCQAAGMGYTKLKTWQGETYRMECVGPHGVQY
jgi:hypothetical protein